jgi:hypothetical protein
MYGLLLFNLQLDLILTSPYHTFQVQSPSSVVIVKAYFDFLVSQYQLASCFLPGGRKGLGCQLSCTCLLAYTCIGTGKIPITLLDNH